MVEERPQPVRVTRHEVGGGGSEHDEPAVVAIDGWSLTPPMACVPLVATLTRTTLPAVPIALRQSRTKTSERVLLSPVTRVVASEANAVHMPLPLIRGVIVSVVGVNRSATPPGVVVVDEDIGEVVGVGGDEVRRYRVERGDAAVVGDVGDRRNLGLASLCGVPSLATLARQTRRSRAS